MSKTDIPEMPFSSTPSRKTYRFKNAPLLLLLVSFLALLSGGGIVAYGQTETGVIQGIVLTQSGEPVEAATVYIALPDSLGVRIVMTGKTGAFDLPGLRPGTYALTAEKPGFETVVAEPVLLRAGRTLFVRFELAPTEQEATATMKSSQRGDLSSPRSVTNVGEELLSRLPLARSLSAALAAAPGVVSAGPIFDSGISLHGSGWRTGVYRLDGINITDNVTYAPVADLHAAVVEEMETVTAAPAASQIPAGEPFINIVSKSGGSAAGGELGMGFISDGFNKDLWSESQAEKMGVAPSAGTKNYFEPFLSLGGSLWADRVLFFTAGRFLKTSSENIFVAPFTDVRGRSQSGYEWSRRDISGFFKLNVRPVANIQAAAWVFLTDTDQPVSEAPSPRLPFISTHILDKDRVLALHGAGDYFLDQNTLVSGRASYLRRTALSLLQEEAGALFWSDDAGDLYGPLSGADYNAEVKREQIQIDATGRRFAENFGGMRHVLNAGFNFFQATAYVDWWRANNMLWHLDSRRSENSFYPEEGIVGFWLCGPEKTSTVIRGETQRLGGYVADTITLGQRLTFSLGLRVDYVSGGFAGSSKTVSGNTLSYYAGEAIIRPYSKKMYPDVFADGLNPWGALTLRDTGDFISWMAFSPRIGMVANLWGDGRTLARASYARYADDLTSRDLLPLHSLYPGTISFFWLDANGDGRPDREDEFRLASTDLRFLANPYLAKRVSPDLKAPVTEEVSAGIQQALGKEVTIDVRFVARRQNNILADVPVDPETGDAWYKASEGAGKNRWIPFTTTVPGSGGFQDQTVRLYARSEQAPPLFRQLRNVPELERRYRAFELSFEKRMSHGWQLAGTLILSRSEGNAGVASGGQFAGSSSAGIAMPGNMNGPAVPSWVPWSGTGSLEGPGYGNGSAAYPGGITGPSAIFVDPNSFINRWGRLDTDRPVVFSLHGAIEVPLGFLLSASFHYQSGRPWQRWARILPPAEWAAANGVERIYYAVNLEPGGSRREPAWSALNLRVEKNWKAGAAGRFRLAADVMNILGHKASIEGLNDVDIWEPAAEGANKPGLLTPAPDYGKTHALLGKRLLRITFAFVF